MSSKPTTNDGVEFFNAQDKNGNYKSSLGYYKSTSHPAGTPPDSLIDISNGYTHWESQNQQATFPDGNVFSWFINADAQKQAVQDYCGVSSNNYRNFAVKKSDDLIKFTLDGWEYVSIYWCG